MTSPAAEKLLQRAAEDGSLDAADWPEALKYILARLDEIVAEFPKPPEAGAEANPSTPDKENAAPKTPALPAETITFYSSIRNALSTNFPKGAPHTIQRLAELVLEPKRRYRFLSPYLRALDRVVSVSSSNNIFPLPQAVLPTATGVLNGTTLTNPAQASLGSDESLGGALLTPIPWLQNRGQNELISESTEIVDGPNGAGRIETVTVGMLSGANGGNGSPQTTSPTASTAVSQIASSHPDGETLPSTGPVTQGEILRQEQEAGIVLNNPHSLTANLVRSTAAAGESAPASDNNTVMDTVEPEDEQPHARGPELIGMEDTGPQHTSSHLDIEGAVGRPSIEHESRSPQPDVESKDREMKDGDGDDGGDAEVGGEGKKKDDNDNDGDGDGDGDSEMKSD